MAEVYTWVGNNTSYGQLVGNVSGNFDWSDVDDWVSSTYPAPQPPSDGDTVIITGVLSNFDNNPFTNLPATWAYVEGGGDAQTLIAYGPVVLTDGTYNFGAATDTNSDAVLGAGITVEYQGDLMLDATVNVTGDLDFVNQYTTGFGYFAVLEVGGDVTVDGNLGIAFATKVTVDGTGTLSVGSVTPDGVNPVGSYITLTVTGSGAFTDTGAFQDGTIVADDHATILISGATSIQATVTASNSAAVTLDAPVIAGSYVVDGDSASIAVNDSASGGEFALGGDVQASGGVSATEIGIDGTLEVVSGAGETLTGELVGDGVLQIDAQSTLTLDGAFSPTSKLSIDFNGSAGTLNLFDAATQTGAIPAEVKGFAAGDLIYLQGLQNAEIVNEQEVAGALQLTLAGDFNGAALVSQLTLDNVEPGQVAVSQVNTGGTDIQIASSPTASTAYDWSGAGTTNAWSDIGNWANAVTGAAATQAPGANDLVTLNGPASGAPLVVVAPGAAQSLVLGGQVALQGGGAFTTSTVSEESGAATTVESGSGLNSRATLNVSGDYVAGAGATLTISGSNVNVNGAYDENTGHTLVVQNQGSFSTASVAPIGASGDESVVGANYAVLDSGFQDRGNFAGEGDKISVTGGSFAVDGTATLGGDTFTAADDGVDAGTVSLASIANPTSGATSNSFTVESNNAWIDLGGSAAQGGDFVLESGQTLSGGGTITAPSIVIDGALLVGAGQSETLNGTLSGTGEEEIEGGTLTVDGVSSSQNTIVFNGAGTLVVAASSLDGSGAVDSTIQGFGLSNTIELQGLDAATATYDATTGQLTAFDASNQAVATFTLSGANLASDTFVVSNAGGASLIDLSTGGDSTTPPSGDGGGSFTWSALSGSWDNVANWGSAGLAPGANDQVTINAPAGYTDVITGTGDASQLQIGGSVTFDGAFVDGGVVNEAGGATVGVASGASLQAIGNLNVGPSGGVDVNGALTANVLYIDATNATIDVGGSGNFSVTGIQYGNGVGDPNGTYVVAAGGTLNIGSPVVSSLQTAFAGIEAPQGRFVLDPGQTLAGGGSITASQIEIDGTLEVQSGDTETLNGELTGTGKLQIDAGATLTLAGATDPNATNTVVFNGAGAELALTAATQQAGAISPTLDDFVAGDQIDLVGFSNASIQSEAINNNDTTLTVGGTLAGVATTVQLTFSGLPVGLFPLTSDGAGGTLVEAPATGYYFTQGAGDWGSDSSWTTTGGNQATQPPGASDDATIDATSGPIDVTGTGAANLLTLGGAVTFQGATITAASIAAFAGATITVDDNGVLQATGAFNQQSGSLEVADGTLTATAATLGSDAVNANSNGVIQFGGLINPTDIKDALDNSFLVDGTSSIEIGSGGGPSAGVFLIDAGRTLSGGGSISAADDIVVNGALTVQTGDTETLTGALEGSGVLNIDAGATLALNGPGLQSPAPTIQFNGAGATLNVPSATLFPSNGDDDLASTVAGFVSGDFIDLTDLSSANIVSQNGSGDNTIVVIDGYAEGQYVHEQITLADNDLAGTLSLQQDNGSGTFLETSVAPCYVRGTRILTARGEVAVEALVIGDLAVTASGAMRPIIWLGHRALDLRRHRDPDLVRPIRVAAGAFGEGLPHRDLWLSPGHNIACDGALIPASLLINGRSVAQIDREKVEYWHVELDAHDILLAEGLPAESYLDTGNRTAFANGGAFVEAHPDFKPRYWSDTCLPLAQGGPAVAATKARLLARLAAKGQGVSRDPDAHIAVDGLRVEPTRLGDTRLVFALPAGGRKIALRSKAFVPAHTVPESGDIRELGLCVAGLEIDGSAVALDVDDACAAGWREAESVHGRFSHRWTTGATPLPAGACRVILDLAGDGYYWTEPELAVADQMA